MRTRNSHLKRKKIRFINVIIPPVEAFSMKHKCCKSTEFLFNLTGSTFCPHSFLIASWVMPFIMREWVKCTGQRIKIWAFFWSHVALSGAACEILVPWSGVKPAPSAMKVQSPNHWTTGEFPTLGVSASLSAKGSCWTRWILRYSLLAKVH